jgi:predicted alpha/beta superfamily hydrolase
MRAAPRRQAHGHASRRVLPHVWSPQLRNERDIDVYLPPSYPRTRRRYPVIYMQDGQNLADPHRAFAGTWNLEPTVAELSTRGIEAILVGVPNMGKDRLKEYSPFRDARLGGGSGNAYLAFLTETVKPRVDRRFRTRAERSATGMFGSSMGALISLYAFFRASETFGLVGAMSPSVWFAGRALLTTVASDGAPPGRVYLDVGTEEGAGTLRDVRLLAQLLRRKGYRDGESLLFVEAPGGRHEEAHWGGRLIGALEFLLRPLARSSGARIEKL